MTQSRIRSGLRIPMDLNTQLILLARKRGMSKNALMLDILWRYLENKEVGVQCN